MKKNIHFMLFLWVSFLLVPCSSLFSQSLSGSISFFKGGKELKKVAPPVQNSPILKLDAFDIIGCWSALSEIGTDGQEDINTVFPEGAHYVWFNSDGTYYQQDGYTGMTGIFRHWWYLGNNSFGDSDGFIFTIASYENGILILNATNTEVSGYSTVLTLKRDKKISLSIGRGYGYLDYNDGRYLKGAVADGETKLRIDAKSIIYDYASYKIELTSSLGNDEVICGKAGELIKTGSTTASFTYVVPKEFPINFYNSYYINVKLTLYDRNSVKLTDGEMVIEIVRPPVLFVHGLNDTGACFAKFTSYLQNRNLYYPFQLYRCDYSSTNTSSFASNANVVENGLIKLFFNCYQEGYIGSKANIIGHSMGGLLSRVYLQNKSHNGVNRLITLNTPHFGSQGASLIINDVFPYTFADLGSVIFKEQRAKAVVDLMVNSDAMKQLAFSSNNLKGVPIHTVCSDYTGNWQATSVGFVVLKAIIELFTPYLGYEVKPFSINKLAELIYKGKSDLVVSLTSQQGGLNGACTSTFSGTDLSYTHTGTPGSVEIHNYLAGLLTEPNNEHAFTTGGLVNKVEPDLDKIDIKKIYDEIFYIQPGQRSESATTKALTSSIRIKNCSVDESRTLNVDCEIDSDIANYRLIIAEGEENISTEEKLSIHRSLSTDFDGEIKVYALGITKSGEFVMDYADTKISCVLGEDDYVEFESYTDTLIIFKDEAVAPLLRLYTDDGYKLVKPDNYLLPDMFGPNDAAKILDGHVYGAAVGSGMLAAMYDEDGDIIPYKVVDPTSITVSGDDPTAIEQLESRPAQIEGFVGFTYYTDGKYALLSFADENKLPMQCLIYDIDGKLYGQHQICFRADYKLDFKQFKSGVYIAVFILNNQKQSFKFIIK